MMAIAIFPLGWIAIDLGLAVVWPAFTPDGAIFIGVVLYFIAARLWKRKSTSKRSILLKLVSVACSIAALAVVLVVSPNLFWDIQGLVQDPLSPPAAGVPPCSVNQWKIPSPGGRYVATVRVIGCTGTYDGSQDNFVFVQHNTKSPPSIHDLALNYIPDWGSWVEVPKVHWLGPRTLAISTKKNQVMWIISQRDRVAGVKIRYNMAAPFCKPASNLFRAFFRLCG